MLLVMDEMRSTFEEFSVFANTITAVVYISLVKTIKRLIHDMPDSSRLKLTAHVSLQ